jgi:hypothetical protein
MVLHRPIEITRVTGQVLSRQEWGQGATTSLSRLSVNRHPLKSLRRYDI